MTKLVANDQIGGGEAVAAGLGKLGPTKRTFRYCAFLLGTSVYIYLPSKHVNNRDSKIKLPAFLLREGRIEKINHIMYVKQ